MNEALEANLWSVVSGMALVIGAVGGYFLHFGRRTIAGIMAFGSGVLISVLSFDLMDEAFYHRRHNTQCSGIFVRRPYLYRGQ